MLWGVVHRADGGAGCASAHHASFPRVRQSISLLKGDLCPIFASLRHGGAARAATFIISCSKPYPQRSQPCIFDRHRDQPRKGGSEGVALPRSPSAGAVQSTRNAECRRSDLNRHEVAPTGFLRSALWKLCSGVCRLVTTGYPDPSLGAWSPRSSSPRRTWSPSSSRRRSAARGAGSSRAGAAAGWRRRPSRRA